MRKKLLAFMTLVICLCILCVSCAANKTIAFKNLVEKDSYTPDKTVTNVTKLDVEGEYTQAEGSLVLFTKIGTTGLATYSIYNMESGKTVFTANAAEVTIPDGLSVTTYEVYLNETNDTSWFFVKEITTKTKTEDAKVITSAVITLYKADGTSVASDSSSNVLINNVKAPQAMQDLIYFDEAFYRISEEGSIDKLVDYNSFREIPLLVWSNDDYYYGSYMGGESLCVFDKELNFVTSYNLPDYAEVNAYAILDDGNLFVQYSVRCNDNAEDYTYFDEDAVKVLLTSVIIDAKSGKEKEVELDFVVDYITSDKGELEFSEDIKNIAVINYIVDERVDFADAACVVVSLDNNMKIKGEINGYVPGTVCEIEPIANNRWLVDTSEGQSFLLDEEGTVIGEITNSNDLNEIYIVNNNKVYDMNLELKCDLDEYGAISHKLFGNAVVFDTFDGETKAYVNGEVKTLIGKDEEKTIEYLADKAFVIVDEKTPGTAVIYNDKIESVYTISDSSLTLVSDATVLDHSEEYTIISFACVKADSEPEIMYFVLK